MASEMALLLAMAPWVVFDVVLPLPKWWGCSDLPLPKWWGCLIIYPGHMCGMGCFVYLSWALGEDYYLSGFQGRRFGSALGVGIGFTCGTFVTGCLWGFWVSSVKGLLTKYSIFDAPTRRVWSWNWKIWAFLFQPDHYIYRAWVFIVRNCVV